MKKVVKLKEVVVFKNVSEEVVRKFCDKTGQLALLLPKKGKIDTYTKKQLIKKLGLYKNGMDV